MLVLMQTEDQKGVITVMKIILKLEYKNVY